MQIISGKVAAPRRVLLYGQHGVGKSNWAAKAPKPLFLNLEDGLNDVECDKTPLLRSVGEVADALMWLDSAEHDYQTVVVDTIDWLERLIHEHEVKAINKADIKTLADVGYGKGYPRATPHWERLLLCLDNLRRHRRMGVILLAHAKVERFQSPESDSYDRYSLDLHKEANGMIQEWCDEVLFAAFRVNTRKVEEGFNRERVLAVGGRERYIRTNESAAAIAKNRLGLPDELPMEWNAYAAAVAASRVARPEQVTVRGDIAGMVNGGSSKKPATKSQTEVEAEQVF